MVDDKEQLLKKANMWLKMAIKKEAEGKPESDVDAALEKACGYENDAFK